MDKILHGDGFSEMSHDEMQSVDGGFIGCIVIGIIIGYCIAKKLA
ncbi:MAG: Blp family class II bacteriocin [Defluviitaleaceae bacterium]|nr:Blp family class II bacteriocin [Defluviitaleaceae bacterium]